MTDAHEHPVLRVEDVSVQRGSWQVRLPHLAIDRGSVVAVTGPSGCGKSTLLELLGLLLRPDRLGCYQLGDAPAQDMTAWVRVSDQNRLADVRARRLGFVLQTGGLLPFLTVEQNIQLPRRMLGLPAESPVVDHALSGLSVEALRHKYPAQLSIGERQRVAFVRAIAHEPDVLLADEPTAALDPPQSRQLFELMMDQVQALNMAALVVTHDWALVQDCGLLRFEGHATTGGTCFEPS